MHFMEPEGSSPHSQVPANCPYPEPARSSPYRHIPLPEDTTYILLDIACNCVEILGWQENVQPEIMDWKE